MTTKYYIYIGFLWLFCNISNAQENLNILDKRIDIREGTYLLSNVLEQIDQVPGVNIIYNSNDLPLDQEIIITSHVATIKEILDFINANSALEYLIKDEYIIIKKRKLEKEYKITGIIRSNDNNDIMIGVNIYDKKSMKGGISNATGEYTISYPPGNYRLIYRYLGYKIKEIYVNLYNDIELDVVLCSEEKEIEEVKITAQRQFFGDMDVGRTIVTVKAKEIENLNTNNASDILHARLPGVWATKVSGAPGDHQKINVRGINSILVSTDPLYIVDGVPVPIVNLTSLGIADVNINDIEDVIVLKDASSTALYGYQGGNGVVIITTKRGGEPKINFSTKYGIQYFDNQYNFMNTKDFLNSIAKADKLFGYDSTLIKKYPEYSDSISNTDWQEAIFRTGVVKEYQLSASGALKNIKYYTSGNIFNHEGIIENSSYDKYSFITNLSKTFYKRLSVELLYKGSKQNNKNNLDSYLGNNLIFEGINKPPCLRDIQYKFNSSYNEDEIKIVHYYEPLLRGDDTDSLITQETRMLDITSNSIHSKAKFRIIDNLFFNASSSVSLKKYNITSEINRYMYNRDNNYLSTTENYIILNKQFNFTYNKNFELNEFNLITGYRDYKDNVYWKVDSLTIDIQSLTNQENIYSRYSLAKFGENGAVIRQIRSFIGHFNYNYNKKYFLSIALNYDFLKEGRYVNTKDFFPSIALNWDMAEEFWFDNINWINNFNFYVNWGKVGNYPLNGLSNDLYKRSSYAYNWDTIHFGASISQLSNHNIEHEKIEEVNYGTEINLFKDRLKFNIDLYHKTNSDLILQYDAPLYYGGGRVFVNVGEMMNYGQEYTFELIPVSTSNILWQAKFSLSKNQQKINKLSNDTLYYYNDDILIPDFIIEDGEELGGIYGYKYLGKWNSEIDNSDNDYVRDENLIYLNSDKESMKLTDEDKVKIGKTIPDLTFNWYNSIKYKAFNIDFLWYGVIGVDKYNATKAASIMAGVNREAHTLIMDTIQGIESSVFYESSYFIDDASFIRLKNLTFSYEPKAKLFKYANIKLSLSFENIVTITKYTGYDPEATIYTDNGFSDYAIDRGAYPNPKAIYFKLGLTL